MKRVPGVLQRILITVLVLALGIAMVGTDIAWANAQVINSFLGSKSFEVVEDPNAENLDTEYYKSDYDNLGDLIAAGAATTEEVMAEGAVLLKNENGALPLDSGNKVSVFGTASADPVYGGTGSGSVDTSKAVDFYNGFEGAGLVLNPTLKEKISGEWFTKPAGGGWPPVYEDYDGSIHFRRHDSFFFDGSGSKYIGEIPWNLVEEGAGSTFAQYGDAAIYVIARVGGEGTDSKMEGAADGLNGDYLALNQKERDTLAGLSQLRRSGVFKKLVVILNGAIVPELDFLKSDEFAVDAALWVGGLGQNGGAAVGKLLTGEYVPSGHSSDTLWYDNSQNPVNVNFGVFQFTNEEDFASYGIPLHQGGNDVLRPAHTSYVVYQEGMYMGYRYTETRYEDYVMGTPNVGEFDYDKAVAYPFGFGLSYTQFQFSNFKVEKTDARTYQVSVDVKNVGDTYSGKEVVQIYVSKPNGDYAKANQIQVPSVELVDFGKTDILAPGETQTVTIPVDEKFFASYDSFGAGTYVIMDGTYYITAATDAHNAVNNILAAKGYSGGKMTGSGDAAMVESIHESFNDQKYRFSDATGAEIGNLFAFADMNTYSGRGDNSIQYYDRNNWSGTVSLDRRDYVKLTLTAQMAEEMMEQTPDGSKTYGMAEYPLPTDDEWYAAHPDDDQYPREYPTYGEGRISDDLCAISLVSMMKDDEGNLIDINDPAWETFMDQLTFEEQVTLITVGQHVTAGLDSIAKPTVKDENGPNGFNQVYGKGQNGLAYRTEVKLGHVDGEGALTDEADPNTALKTTAMPTNGVIAATFNRDLAYKAGNIIGNDGIWAGCGGLYGVGCNLHRTSYQGRAAEYYSEDGILTGFIAGAESKGIEDKGVHVYNKHCALNEQEDTRHGLSTWTTEQTIRELYLRAFELPITEGGAYNTMASFNRFGTITGAACGALGQDFLRGECGMKGIIVTDMYTDMTGYRTIAPYFQMTYGIYYGGCDLPDGNNIQTPDKEEGMFLKYGPDASGDYSRMAWKIRESAKRILYASAHSNAMNGLSSGTRFHQITTNWQKALIAANVVFGVGLAATLAWTVVSYVKTRKKSK